jgi:hypothetical protein
LANTYFTTAQLAQVQREAMTLISPKCGYNRISKREILFGPLQFGGANFHHLNDQQQGIGQLTLFMRQWRQNA